MKNLFLPLLLILALQAGAQVTTKVQGDSVKITQIGGNPAELIIENNTKSINGGFLRNRANGRTYFAYALDSVWQEGSLLKFRRGGSTSSFNIFGASVADIPGLQDSLNTRIPFTDTTLLIATHGYVANAVANGNTAFGWGNHAAAGYLPSTTAATTYFPLAGGSITGTAGTGFIGFPAQSSAPSTPASGVRVYARSTGALSWIGTNGFTRSFVAGGLTADRSYTLKDADGTLAFTSDIPTDNATLSNGAAYLTSSTGVTLGTTQTITGIKTFSSTTTATSSSQIQNLFGGSFTARATSSDVLLPYSFNPTLIATASSQRLIGLDINPTYTDGVNSNVQHIGLRMQSGTALFGFGSSQGSYVLQANGLALFQTTSSVGVQFLSSNATTGLIRIMNASGSNYTDVGMDNTTDMVIKVNGAQKLSISQTGGVRLNSSNLNAVSGSAIGLNIGQSMKATANGDTLIGMSIDPIWSDSTFTGVQRVALRLRGGTLRLAQLSADPTVGSNGGMFYNTTTNTMRGFENGSFKSFAMQTSDVTFNTLTITAAPVYADNAAALAGGLTAGKTYRTSTGDFKIVY